MRRRMKMWVLPLKVWHCISTGRLCHLLRLGSVTTFPPHLNQYIILSYWMWKACRLAFRY